MKHAQQHCIIRNYTQHSRASALSLPFRCVFLVARRVSRDLKELLSLSLRETCLAEAACFHLDPSSTQITETANQLTATRSLTPFGDFTGEIHDSRRLSTTICPLADLYERKGGATSLRRGVIFSFHPRIESTSDPRSTDAARETEMTRIEPRRRFRAHKERRQRVTGVRHYSDYRLGTIIVMIIIVTAANTLGSSSRGHANLIVFLVGFFGEESGLLQLILKGVHALFVRQAAVLENLAGALRWTHVERKRFTIKNRLHKWR